MPQKSQKKPTKLMSNQSMSEPQPIPKPVEFQIETTKREPQHNLFYVACCDYSKLKEFMRGE